MEKLYFKKATFFFEKIAYQGIPMKKLNNNHNAKKIERLFKLTQEGNTQIDFEKFSKMEYKDILQEASKNLSTSQAKKSL